MRDKRYSRRKAERQDQIYLMLIGLVVIVLLAVATYSDYNAWVCEGVPNHYSCS